MRLARANGQATEVDVPMADKISEPMAKMDTFHFLHPAIMRNIALEP